MSPSPNRMSSASPIDYSSTWRENSFQTPDKEQKKITSNPEIQKNASEIIKNMLRLAYNFKYNNF